MRDKSWSAWLIETVPQYPGAETHYYCSDGGWCSNPNHAWKFGTEEEAKEKAATMRSVVRVASHMWESGPKT